MRIIIVTDAWSPQVNGVVRTLQTMQAQLERMGHEVKLISPDLFGSIPCPTYPEIRLAFARSGVVGRMIAAFRPDAIHLATEGPLCLAARRWCLRGGIRFTTAYHTHFPDYVAQRTGLPAAWFWRYIRWFHGPAEAVLASTPSVRRQLRAHGLAQVRPWGRGVDLTAFTPQATPPAFFAGLPRPIQLYVGRVAVEKNLEAFLASGHPGAKVVVGDGPARAMLENAYPQAHFLGPMFGTELAGAYAGADIFVFPSRTDTFGLVMIEALACGTPVAAYPVTGPVDIVTPESGALSDRLEDAIAAALLCDRGACAAHGRSFSWERSAGEFLAGLHNIDPQALDSAA
ncbi:GDP-mannose-dependent alpha-mannosyltransferase [Sphingobium indicum IP26]|uniref:GDP-mannose-dependent alpha-mannosyltransferase n=1 Tax=Sphingobium indicum F2 TaxID=1450518 RepID=A0A8E0WR48_9SPHN|nr:MULTISPECIES: glycosyltransferase family 1 protein [Sphingobium]EPR16534.1 GDP-mannose-dependent alpha-mannosyltransferase [Sphingobium indicum IP26]EQA99366.1 GDP-mannose-dependent alpha-mannosyltransferase [Sphingobium sp. HDIP04]KER35719.1 GDP-mannose-dependent alpha-mannosyltransferase [Sphingobium indicum F2]